MDKHWNGSAFSGFCFLPRFTGDNLQAQGQTPKSRNGSRKGWPNDSSKSGSLRLDPVCVCVCVWAGGSVCITRWEAKDYALGTRQLPLFNPVSAIYLLCDPDNPLTSLSRSSWRSSKSSTLQSSLIQNTLCPFTLPGYSCSQQSPFSLGMLANSSFKVQLKCHLLWKTFLGSPWQS